MTWGRTKYNEFGVSVSSALADRHMTQTGLAEAANVSVGYVNHMMVGRTIVSPKWADLVADILKMSEVQRKTLHVAAAKSAGYKLDLTPSKKNRS